MKAHTCSAVRRTARGGEPSPLVPQVDTKGDCPSAPRLQLLLVCIFLLLELLPALTGRRKLWVGDKHVSAGVNQSPLLTARAISPVPYSSASHPPLRAWEFTDHPCPGCLYSCLPVVRCTLVNLNQAFDLSNPVKASILFA